MTEGSPSSMRRASDSSQLICIRTEPAARLREEGADWQDAARTDETGHLHAERRERDQVDNAEQTQKEPARKDKGQSQ